MTSPTGASLLSNQNDLQSGEHLIDGQSLSAIIQWSLSSQAGLVGLAGGGAPGAPTLSARQNVLETVASANDSVQLPFGVAGMIISVINLTVTAAKVWPNAGVNPQTGIADAMINLAGAAVTVGSTLPGNGNISYYCYKPGLWKSTI